MNNLEVIAIMANDRMKREAFVFDAEKQIIKSSESPVISMYAEPRLKLFLLEKEGKVPYRCYSLQEAVEMLLISINS